MKIIKDKISVDELMEMAEEMFGNFVKAVVDVESKIIAVDAELHSDEEALLLENGSAQKDLWGVNLYPELSNGDFIEFDSMINLRPSCGNHSRGVDSPETREKIIKIINERVGK